MNRGASVDIVFLLLMAALFAATFAIIFGFEHLRK